MVNIDNAIFPALSIISAHLSKFEPFPFPAGFDIQKVASAAQSLPEHSWEFGTAAQALLELHNPELSVFGAQPFPVPSISNLSSVPALKYAADSVKFGTSYHALAKGDGAAGDPPSLGVSAVMLGKTDARFAKAADETVGGLFNDVPRFANGAISHRADVPELWADWMYMVPPFLAYYAVDKGDQGLLQETINQITLYRQVLSPNPTSSSSKGLWMHIIGPQSQDTGHWSTGNAWVAAGMTRVLATVMKSDNKSTNADFRRSTAALLTGYIKEIVDGAMQASLDHGLLRNYIDNVDNWDGTGFGEVSGSSLFAATIYRMAVLQPTIFDAKYISWADGLRKAVASGKDVNGRPHITAEGIATPAVNPMWWKDTKPFTTGSPEGQAFVVLMYAGWRDCVKAEKCASASTNEEKVDAVVNKRALHRRHF